MIQAEKVAEKVHHPTPRAHDLTGFETQVEEELILVT
jgi:hypothetical protein